MPLKSLKAGGQPISVPLVRHQSAFFHQSAWVLVVVVVATAGCAASETSETSETSEIFGLTVIGA